MNDYSTMPEFELKQIRAEKIDSMNQMHNKAVSEKRELSAKENNEWNGMKEAIKDIDVAIREQQLKVQNANEYFVSKDTIRSKDFQKNMNRISSKNDNTFGKLAIARKTNPDEYRNITSTVSANTIPSEVIQQLFYLL